MQQFEAFVEVNNIIHGHDDQDVWRLLPLLDMDDMFSRVNNPVIINHTEFDSENFAESITKMVYSENGPEIAFVATCDCGYLDNRYVGSVCPRCGQTVNSNFVDNLQHRVWISTPDKIKAFIHPMIYLILTDWLKIKGKGCYIDNILNPKGKLPPEVDEYIKGRGFNYFYDNFHYIIDYFMNIHDNTRTSPKVPYIKELLKKYGGIVFCTKLPVMSSKLHTITTRGKSLKYADTGSKSVLDSIIDLATIKMLSQATNVSQHRYDMITYSAYMSYINYIIDIIDGKLAKKKGHFRKHMYGTRKHGSFRAVIVPHVSFHRADELHVPWAIGINTYMLHIINKLVNVRRYKFRDALTKVHKAIVTYDPEISTILRELINDASYKQNIDGKTVSVNLPGLPVWFNRNPSLSTTAIQLLYITKVHDDIHNRSIRMSALICRYFNADYDGVSHRPSHQRWCVETFLTAGTS